METVDVYRITDKLDDPTLDVLEARLETRGRHPRFAAMMHEYFDAMAIDSARLVLDLGCGTGVASRQIARRPGFAGRVTAIDLSPRLIAAGMRLASEEGVDSVIEFRAGDSHGLAIEDASFDAVVANTLFSHLNDPRAVLREMVRLVKPAGMIGIFDGDYASLTFAMDDPDGGKRADEAIINAIVSNPRIMRQMPQLLREANLGLVAAFSYVVADMGHADYWKFAVKSFEKLLPRAGAMTETAAAEWADAMSRRSDEGIFFGASNYYSYVATRP